MLKVLGRPNSINVQKVMWCCGELGLEVDRVDVGGAFGGNDQPEYLAKNPTGLIPTLEDGDFFLWESNSIVRYIAEAYGDDQWFPADRRRRAHANQWMDWYIASVHAPMTVLFRQLIRTSPEDQDAGAIEKARQQAANLWGILDGHLAGRDYLTGDEPTMGDIPAGAAVYRWFTMDIDRPEAPNLRAWYDRLNARPPYREHVMLPLT
jgi:glutathione S-transferase